MTTHGLMGLLALGILWLNGGLVVAVAFKQFGNVLALRKWLQACRAAGELVHGRVAGNGRFALRTIQQIGRAVTTGGPPAIIFSDGRQSFEIVGGALELEEEGALEVAAEHDGRSEVWLDAARIEEGIANPSDADFEESYRDASKPEGCRHEVELEVRGGDRVWVVGRRDGERLSAWENRPLLVSMIDPSSWTALRAWILVGFMIACFLVLAAVTTLVLWPPIFGTVSTIGGALGLACFLGIQPLGTAVRDAVKTPARRLVGATWRKPS